jgi:hypothetical protein
MSITQTVEIPASRRVHLDFEVPVEIPVGKAQVEVKVIPFVKNKEQLKERVFGCAKGKYRMAEDFDAPLEDFKDYM